MTRTLACAFATVVLACGTSTAMPVPASFTQLSQTDDVPGAFTHQP